MKETVRQYFQDNPLAKDDVMKAHYAYHRLKDEKNAHYFSSEQRFSLCTWCGRSREEVRWDDLSPECSKHQDPLDVSSIITDEENKAHALFNKASSHVPKLIKSMGLSGQTLAILHHTHGYDIEIVQSVIDHVPANMKADYEIEMERQRAISRSHQHKEIITTLTPTS